MQISRWAAPLTLLLLCIFAACSSSTGDKAGATSDGGTQNPNQGPAIISFNATTPNLPTSGGQTALNWQVENADSLSIDHGVGTVTGTTTNVTVATTTIFTLTATNKNGASTAVTAVSTGSNPSTADGRFVAMISPSDSETFQTPTTLRLMAAAQDQYNYDGNGDSAALQVQFFVDSNVVLTVNAADAEYYVFKGFANNLALTPGLHTVWARSTNGAFNGANPAVLDSVPMVIHVVTPPTYGSTVDLTANVVFSGSTGYSLTGTSGSHVRLNGHGFSITSNDGASGALTLQFVDVFDLGSESDTSQPGINITTSGAITIEDSTFDTSDTVSASLSGSAPISVQRNLFRSNMRMPLGQYPDAYVNPGASYPVIHFDGMATGTKVLAGNTIGSGWVEFYDTQGWMVGGNTDTDSNVLVGPRVGIHAESSSNMTIRRNYSHHVYYGGWSQGNDFELEDATNSTIEHNVIYGSSWPVRGCAAGCALQYNLVLSAGHQWMQPSPGASIHHNVFVGGDNDIAGIFVYNDPVDPGAAPIDIHNNTFDGQLGPIMTTGFLTDSTAGPVTLASNLYLSVPKGPTVTVDPASTVTTDYNGFFNPQTTNYSDARMPAHDVSGGDPKLGSPPATITISDGPIWTRATTAANILSLYRGYYTPQAGSALIDTGDPAGGAGNDVGAVGAGAANSSDKFGMP